MHIYSQLNVFNHFVNINLDLVVIEGKESSKVNMLPGNRGGFLKWVFLTKTAKCQLGFVF